MQLPKKPVAAAFHFFVRAHLAEFRNNQEHHMKLASAKWKTLGQEDKKEYEATGSFIFLKAQFSAACQCMTCSPSELQQRIVLSNLSPRLALLVSMSQVWYKVVENQFSCSGQTCRPGLQKRGGTSRCFASLQL